jgi:tetratricopeptide (TPR) repeat protein
MRVFYKLFITSVLLASSSFAQTEGSTSNAPVSSLRLSEERTQQKRIGFLLEVGQAYTGEGDLSSAVDAYERILKIDPKHSQARYLVSHLYIQTKQYRKAIALILELIKERPEDYTLLNNLAWIYATAEDPAIRNGGKAIEYAHEAMVRAPNDHHIWSTLSEAYYTSGDYEKAHRAITHMARLATRYGKDINEESIKEYNEQIRKCKRAMETSEAMEELEP